VPKNGRSVPIAVADDGSCVLARSRMDAVNHAARSFATLQAHGATFGRPGARRRSPAEERFASRPALLNLRVLGIKANLPILL
jgi:uncharacterized protein GlcG (DUF336 family)